MSERERLTVALFVGNDVASYLLMNSAVRILVSLDARVFVIQAPDRAPHGVSLDSAQRGSLSGAASALGVGAFPSEQGATHELELLRFWERRVLNELVIPFLLRDPPLSEVGLLPARQLESIFHPNVHTLRVRDLTDHSTLDHLHARGINCGIVLGAGARVRSPLMNYFRAAGAGTNAPRFINLHPGLLPQFRGKMSHFYAMARGETHSGYTLHQVTEEGDSGPVLGLRRSRLDYSRSLLWNSFTLASEGASLLTHYLHLLAHGAAVTGSVQDEYVAGSFSAPGEVELAEFREAGCTTVCPEEDVAIYTQRILNGIPGAGMLASQLTKLAQRKAPGIELHTIPAPPEPLLKTARR